MVITPDISTLEYTMKNGIKYFELVAEPVNQEILPGVFIKGWGYNGSIPGPTIQVYPGDYISIRVINQLPEATSIHWHGLNVPNVMDGVPEVEPSPRIEPGHYFDYHFHINNPPGTHMYHSHVNVAKQDMLGLLGGFVILDPHEINVNKDYLLLMQEWSLSGLQKGEKVKTGQYHLNPFAMEFNMFTINGKSFPSTTPMAIEYGDIVRLRLGAIQINHHPMHIHGHQFLIEKSDGNSIVNNRIFKNTILVATGETWDVIFKANNPGIWPFHCHIAHHVSNNFTDGTGGMFTTLVYK
ncbi:copper oxidase [Lysinibacillus sphaericus]|uniref:Copper oxidase n=3 Tax=Lysinibacillus TaxID=400634 RepID=A0A2S0K0E8_LYSSH|nr:MULTISPECIES: copper oxidase [Lysinibacillus]AHN21974.1 multicopper oxidase [Lysinibacillus varians]AVK96816.1 copper oxidase [Lysinibacillus sphaericus]MED4545718.1 copper oxidase [Lysinibacillus sphaericus]TKI16719.1 copper oxidase [Lysinibacillus sphaericus]TKI47209.1 copper oxidase [Lysinibacillus tabacifolii]